MTVAQLNQKNKIVLGLTKKRGQGYALCTRMYSVRVK